MEGFAGVPLQFVPMYFPIYFFLKNLFFSRNLYSIQFQVIMNLAALKLNLEATAVLEIQKFTSTDSFDCIEDIHQFDTCALDASYTRSPCILPFQNLSAKHSMFVSLCKYPEEGYIAFNQFQQGPRTCRVSCTQLNTVLDYYIPQYIRRLFLKYTKPVQLSYYYINLPSAIKVSKTSFSYSFISFIAEVAGWYNLFLGGSLLAMWEVLGAKILLPISNAEVKLTQLFPNLWKNFFLLICFGILSYITLGCVTLLVNNPVRISTLLQSSINQGLSMSVCYQQETSLFPRNNFDITDIANTASFWDNGRNLSNRISELNVTLSDGSIISLWNSSHSPISTKTLFNIFNIVSSNYTVDFCHTLDLSRVSKSLSSIQVKAVSDITLVIHLAGQLLISHNKYAIGNLETLLEHGGSIFSLYNSQVHLELEETSFTSVNSKDCKIYNTSWTFDDCLLDFALLKLGNQSEVLNKLLRPNGYTIQQGIEQKILQRLYEALLSQNVQTACKPDCRSLVVKMRAEVSTTKAQPTRGITSSQANFPVPLPPMLIEVNITLPEMSIFN